MSLLDKVREESETIPTEGDYPIVKQKHARLLSIDVGIIKHKLSGIAFSGIHSASEKRPTLASKLQELQENVHGTAKDVGNATKVARDFLDSLHSPSFLPYGRELSREMLSLEQVFKNQVDEIIGTHDKLFGFFYSSGLEAANKKDKKTATERIAAMDTLSKSYGQLTKHGRARSQDISRYRGLEPERAKLSSELNEFLTYYRKGAWTLEWLKKKAARFLCKKRMFSRKSPSKYEIESRTSMFLNGILYAKLIDDEVGSLDNGLIDSYNDLRSRILSRATEISANTEFVKSMKEGSLSIDDLTKLKDILGITSVGKYSTHDGIIYLEEHIAQYRESAAELRDKVTALTTHESERLQSRYQALKTRSTDVPGSFSDVDDYLARIDKFSAKLEGIKQRAHILGEKDTAWKASALLQDNKSRAEELREAQQSYQGLQELKTAVSTLSRRAEHVVLSLEELRSMVTLNNELVSDDTSIMNEALMAEYNSDVGELKGKLSALISHETESLQSSYDQIELDGNTDAQMFCQLEGHLMNVKGFVITLEPMEQRASALGDEGLANKISALKQHNGSKVEDLEKAQQAYAGLKKRETDVNSLKERLEQRGLDLDIITQLVAFDNQLITENVDIGYEPLRGHYEHKASEFQASICSVIEQHADADEVYTPQTKDIAYDIGVLEEKKAHLVGIREGSKSENGVKKAITDWISYVGANLQKLYETRDRKQKIEDDSAQMKKTLEEKAQPLLGSVDQGDLDEQLKKATALRLNYNPTVHDQWEGDCYLGSSVNNYLDQATSLGDTLADIFDTITDAYDAIAHEQVA